MTGAFNAAFWTKCLDEFKVKTAINALRRSRDYSQRLDLSTGCTG